MKTVSDTGRPRILLADDDAGILKAISRTLATDFHVVATVTNGRDALDIVPALDPDAVVLDARHFAIVALTSARCCSYPCS